MISGNLDSPEGGFDAMLQVITCQNVRYIIFLYLLLDIIKYGGTLYSL